MKNIFFYQAHKLAFWLCTLLIVFFSYSKGVDNILTWDVFGQYVYLPEIFNNGTIYYKDYAYLEGINKVYNNTPYFYQFVQSDSGFLLTKYTSGWAVLMSPFYFLAKLICYSTGYVDDGFSLPFQYVMSFGATFYTVLGIYFLIKILRKFFSTLTSGLVLLFTVLGTNFFFMNYVSKGSTNNLEFTVITFMFWQMIQFHETYKKRFAFGLGLALGLITLVRPPDLLLILIPLGWNVRYYGGLIPKMKEFLKFHKTKLLIIIGVFLALVFVQLTYWYLLTGNFLMNSYANNPGEGFDWFTPYTFQFLFSFRKGWLLYTPMMFFGVIGLFLWVKESKSHSLYPVITFLLFLYVVSCWTTWWYADSFSQRAMIDIYALLAIGMAFLVEKMVFSKSYFWLSLMIVLMFFNLFQTYQVDRGIIHTSRMSKEYYFSVFGQIEPPSEEQNDLLLIDKIDRIYNGFKDVDRYKVCFRKKVKFPKRTIINSLNPYTPVIDLPVGEISKKDHFWLKSIFSYKGSVEGLKGKIFNAAAFFKGKSYQYNGKFYDDPLIKLDTINKTVEFDYLSPDFRSKDDIIRIVVYCESGRELEVNGVEVFGYERR